MVRVYLGCSLDGFIAGPEHDLSWLDRASRPDSPADTGSLQFSDFMTQIGCMLMGRTTYDVVTSFDAWPYGDTPVRVATRRPLDPVSPTVQGVSGDIRTLIDEARAVAGTLDVYLDGGALVRSALDADLVDELTLTYLPVILGGGVRLFGDRTSPLDVRFTAHHWHGTGGAVQITIDRRSLR